VSVLVVMPRGLGDDPPSAHHQHPVSQPEDLLDLGGDQEHAHPLGGEADEQVIDGALGTDVDAAGRLVGDQHARAGHEHPGKQNLLLVAARQRRDRRGVVASLDRDAIEGV